MLQIHAASLFQVDGAQPERDKTLTFDQPVGDLPIVDDARWSAAFTDNSIAALIVWVILLIVLQAVTWPLVKRIFTRFADRGWAFARLTTLLIAGFGVWFFASLQIIAFQAIWAAIVLVLLGVLSWTLAKRLPERKSDRPFWRNPIIIGAEVVFWGVFALFLVYRLINPDSYHPVWGGEKPMEFAHLNAILRSAHFPPVDPWYSGGYINYYYYGTYLVAFMIKLTGIPIEIAFNLAQPTFPALLATGSFSLAAAFGHRLTKSIRGTLLTGLLGAFFIQFAGNLIVAERVIDQIRSGSGPVNDFSYWVFNPTRAIPDADTPINITEFPYFGALYADLHPHVIAMPFTVLIIALAWQLASQWRAVTLTLSRRSAGTFFAIGAPVLLLGLGLGTLFMTNAWDMPMYAVVAAVGVIMATKGIPSIWRRFGVSLITLIVIGVVAIIAILPFMTHYVALFGKIDSVRDRTPLLAIESHLGTQLLLLTVGIAALTIQRSNMPPVRMSAHFAISIAVLVGALFIQLSGNEEGSTFLWLGEFLTVAVIISIWMMAAWSAIDRHSDFNAHSLVLRTEIANILALTIILLAMEYTALALYLGIGLSAAILWLALTAPSERFIMALVAGGTLLGAALELVYLVDDLSGTDWYRMNTIFKFYNQIWILLGISTAALIGRAVWTILVTPETDPAFERSESIENDSPSPWAWVSAGLVIPLAIASLAYAFVATPIRLDQRFGDGGPITLNAYDWMKYGEIPLSVVQENDGQQELVPTDSLKYDDDLAAITWFNENVPGTPVIAEAAFGTYRCNGSRFSISTGLPAVMGWSRHQYQQRYPSDIASRENDLRQLYTEADAERQQAIIDQYNIEYVIIGQTERHYPNQQPSSEGCVDMGSPSAIESLENLPSLEAAFEHETTTVYRVVQP